MVLGELMWWSVVKLWRGVRGFDRIIRRGQLHGSGEGGVALRAVGSASRESYMCHDPASSLLLGAGKNLL